MLGRGQQRLPLITTGGDEVQIFRAVVAMKFVCHQRFFSTELKFLYVTNKPAGEVRVVPSFAKPAKLGQPQLLWCRQRRASQPVFDGWEVEHLGLNSILKSSLL
jgi:hypothetical protein